MTYSCSDFTDSILDALKIEVPEEHYDNPSKQADLALAEIERLEEAKRVAFDLWWFIENVTDTAPDRNDRFFALRERVRAL
jgi:hypothetical protein